MKGKIGILFALSLTFGVFLLQQLAELPSFVLIAVILAVAVWVFRRAAWLSAFLIGFGYAAVHGHLALWETLPSQWEMKDLVAEGRIVSIPDDNGDRIRFNFRVDSLNALSGPLNFKGKIRLSWYENDRPNLHVGEYWVFKVRLKRPWGSLNPGVFDYQAWLWQQGLRATGYVRSSPDNRVFLTGVGDFSIDRWRQAVRDHLLNAVPKETAALIAALTIGERSLFSEGQWNDFRHTGTNHLVAISGLHVGLIAGFLFLLVKGVWRFFPLLCLAIAAPRAAAIAAIVGAVLYAALAGFSVPTQRACIMVAALLLPTILGRQGRPLHGLALALLIVLLIDPRTVTTAGFVLSFSAVGAIIWGLSTWKKREGYLNRLVWLQWVVLLLLMPLTFLYFNQTSLLAFPVNLVAIPWFSLILVPVALIGVLLLAISPSWGSSFFSLAAPLFSHTLETLHVVSSWDAGVFEMADRPAWMMAIACLGAAWLVAPLRLPARYLGVLLVLPIFVRQPDAPSAGSFVVTMLDVGQGLSVLVKTENHLLLYDTGPAFPSGFNAGRAIVVPYLKGKGFISIDRVMISHYSADHVGGLEAVNEKLNIGEVIDTHRLCKSGNHWRWDGVDLHVLHPRNGDEWSSNDSSCVLSVSNSSGKLLLTGDLEGPGESALLERYGDSIRSSVVQVGHHGSKTSSSVDFVAAVSPAYALVANGYRNRYGFPAAEVVKRWRDNGAEVLETASSGAVTIRFDAKNGPSEPVREREGRDRFWR